MDIKILRRVRAESSRRHFHTVAYHRSRCRSIELQRLLGQSVASRRRRSRRQRPLAPSWRRRCLPGTPCASAASISGPAPTQLLRGAGRASLLQCSLAELVVACESCTRRDCTNRCSTLVLRLNTCSTQVLRLDKVVAAGSQPISMQQCCERAKAKISRRPNILMALVSRDAGMYPHRGSSTKATQKSCGLDSIDVYVSSSARSPGRQETSFAVSTLCRSSDPQPASA